MRKSFSASLNLHDSDFDLSEPISCEEENDVEEEDNKVVEGQEVGDFVRELTHVDVKEFSEEGPGHANIPPQES